MQALQDVLNNYLNTKIKTKGVANRIGTADQTAILKDIPDFFLQTVAKRPGNALKHKYTVKGSIGNAVLADVPWVALFHSDVTSSAQNGYYIVLLFAQDMKSCTLSLDQGVTALEKKFKTKRARTKAKQFAACAAQCFTPAPGAILGPIDLGSAGGLGTAYEDAAIESFRYEASNLPTQATVEAHLHTLIDHYERLIQVAGPNLETLAPITEEEYQIAAQEAKAPPAPQAKLPDTPKTKPAPIKAAARTIYPRDPSVAAGALSASSYQCEFEPAHQTFVSKARKQQYTEAHHLVPMSLQGAFQNSLDVEANVVGLCPLCHKLLHLGMPVDKEPLLKKLFAERQNRLQSAGIPMTLKDLFTHYKAELAEEDA